jgi:hypothetical protein
LEALADPGGIDVSRIVHDQVRDKLSFSFEDLGEQTVKNIARPIGVHRIDITESTGPPVVKSTAAALKIQSTSTGPSIAVLPFIVVIGPYMIVRRCINQLRRDAYAISAFADAALQYIAHAQFAGGRGLRQDVRATVQNDSNCDKLSRRFDLRRTDASRPLAGLSPIHLR